MHIEKPTSIKELCEFIWFLEGEYDLLNFEIEGVKPWQAHRLEIYYGLGRACGVFEKNLQRGLTKCKKFKSLINFLGNSIIHNPFSSLHPVDTLVFPHPRSKMLNGELVDIYTYRLVEELIESGRSFYEFEEHFDGNHKREYKKYRRYIDYINLMRNMQSRFININLTDDQVQVLNQVENEIYTSLNKKYPLKDILINRTKKFIITYNMYKKILVKTKPRKVYVVVSYGHSELITVCKDLKIKIIEFQHGTFSKYHLGYSYPNREKLDYFPDEFLVWNKYWQNLIDFPISKQNVKIYPFQYLENEKQKYNTKKIKNQMVVLCQGGLTDRIAKKILNNQVLFENYKLIFKLHPEEYGKSSLYKNLMQLSGELDIRIVENIDLYKLLAQSEYQAGVFSTALYEGVEFECKTILFDLPGIEYMDKFIEMYNIKVV